MTDYRSAPGYPASITDFNTLITNFTGTSAGMIAGSFTNQNNYKIISLDRVFGGFGTVIPTNQTFYLSCPGAGTISGYRLASPDSSGSATVKIWKIASGTALPTVANVISTSGLSITTGTGGANTLIESTTVTDFTNTTVAAKDEFAFTITAASVLTVLGFTLYVTRA